MYLKDNEFFVRSGSLAPGTWSLSSDMLSNGNEKIKITSITSCIIVKDEHSVSHTGVGRIAGGILGAALLGPIGALGGLLSGGKKKVDETIVHCGLDDNRSFTAESSQIGAANLVRIAQQNVRTLNTSNAQSQLTKSNTDDQMECPQCAEVIKRKAKICRFCSLLIPVLVQETLNLKPGLSLDVNTPVIKDLLPTFSDLPYEKFLYAYRRDVSDSPFKTDAEVIHILSIFSDLASQNDDEDTDEYKKISDHQKLVAKKLGVSLLSLDKIFYQAQSYVKIKEKAKKGSGLNYSDTPDCNRALRTILEIRSDIRMAMEGHNYKTEQSLLKKELEKRNLFFDDSIVRYSYFVLRFVRPLPFYIVEDVVFYVDPAIREKKDRKPRLKSADSEENIKVRKPRLKKAVSEEDAKQADEAKLRAFNLLTPSAALAAVVGSTPLARTEVVKKLWDYVKKHKLQDETNKRMINADAKLKEVFGKPQVSMFEMAGLIGEHLK